jgi:type III secretion protein D
MSASQSSKQLRILSGRHAGALLDLTPGNHSIGQDDDSDITITDWAFAPLALRVDRDGRCVAHWSVPMDGAAPNARDHRLDDFVPCDFDGVVACIGPVDGDWPEDAALLARARRPQASLAARAVQVAAGPRRVPVLAGAVVLSLALVGAGWKVAAAASKPRPLPRPTLEATRVDLQRALERVAAGRLQVIAAQDSLAVDGLVETSDEARAVRTVLDAARSPYPVVPRFSTASDVAETIRSAVGLPDAQVKYTGDGVFRLVVKATDVAAAQAAVVRVGVDLAPTVKRIDAVLEDVADKPRATLPPLLASFTSDDVSFIQTRDGVKHLVLGGPGPATAKTRTASSSLVPPGARATLKE